VTRSGKTTPGVYLHKLFVPPTRVGAIQRNAILERIFQRQEARVVLLQGPAGHGKSTLLQQIAATCSANGVNVGWLTLDAADNDARRFFVHMRALLADVANGIAPRATTEEDGDLRRGRRSDWAIDLLLKAGRHQALFFDNFQTLDNPAVLSFFGELCEHLPTNATLYIGSRSVPEIGLSRLMVGNQALVLRADDLRFSSAEVEHFFAAAHDGDNVSADEIAAIYHRTEGWPAALQLFRLALASPAVRRSLDELTSYRPRELAEYLTENVLALQSPATQDFLRRTALLNRLSAPLCNLVSGRDDAQEVLRQLERSGLFVRSLDTDFRWFEYHGLFSSYLAEQLRQQSPERVIEVHRLAARWHLRQGDAEEVLYHAIAAGDFTLAADTLDACASRLIADAHLVTVERWYQQLPFVEIEQRPALAIKVAYAMIFLRRRQALKPLLALLRRLPANGDIAQTRNPDVALCMEAVSVDDMTTAFALAARIPVQAQDAEGFAGFELGAAANVMAYRALAFADFEAVRHHLNLARVHNTRGDATFSRGYTVALHGVSLLVQGKLVEALQCFDDGMALQRMHDDKSVASAALVSCYIWALYEANRLDQAETLFGRYHDIMADSVLMDFLAVGYLSMARIHDARGRPERALAELDHAEAVGRTNGWNRFIATLDWERARRALLAGARDRAEAIIRPHRDHANEPWILFSHDIEDSHLGRIRLAIARGELADATTRLRIERQRQPGRINRQIKLHVLDALLHRARGELSLARLGLREALRLAAPGGFVRSFLEEGPGVIELLEDVTRGAPAPEHDFALQLLAASGGGAPGKASAAPTDALTDREKEILVLLTNGVSNREMAGRIFVSENTIKFHLKNIYAKLSVTSRLQAVTAARQIGLIQ
jgi:LuxR family transcriptional regulator, maltose regulon positive regulatory protein